MSKGKTMNAMTPGRLPNGALARKAGDEKMEQIRELLFGDFSRLANARIGELETRLRELELGLHQRMDELQSRFDALSSDLAAGRRADFDELARGMDDLGTRIRQLPHNELPRNEVPRNELPRNELPGAD